MKNGNIPYIADMRQRLGMEKDDTFMDPKIEEMDAMERTKLITAWNLGDPDWALQFKDWFESQGVIFVDKKKYENIEIFLKRIEKWKPEEEESGNRYMKMVEILREIFDG